ncbi:bifunctional alpha/beta hydrolase/OsmC family protein [Aequorivita echinoideorum]|uniref:Alpha/beta fold hydrolase n=1 Tax=Aequorivita echinoideorum TaxID=1549647 RepID=A0ABS5S8X1_9FLAO|nr:alpha/beta fold hydrolase [Aequorivita echinoideorum]MBT0608864.1 alpha/beta fold hydrolase [Aequorivita echinoideorum]
MNLNKVSFQNKNDENLAGRLELPLDRHPHNFVIFAHCFTCNKNLIAVKNISRALAAEGFGVLRFDFTGLGESEGDFENTNFSGNVDDLIAAAAFLEKEFSAPTLLIGHSLGGAAAIFAASKLPSIKAVAVINTPSDPSHVTNMLRSNREEITQNGKALVNLGGREFTIKKQFLEDIESKSLLNVVRDFKKALLILHSPQDTTVGIHHAEEIYKNAHHPKSFISLNGVDHLISNKEDSKYIGSVIAGWATHYVEINEEVNLSTKRSVAASLDAEDGYSTNLKLGNHYLVADEPETFGGNNFGPSPYEFLSAGLASCTVMTIQMYAKRKKWDLKNVEVHVNYNKDHALDCENCEDSASKIDTFLREIYFEGNLDEKQKKRLLEIADKCPVHRTLITKTQVVTSLLER